MKKVLKIVRNYICYCGIEKEEYNAVKKNAYISNYQVWRVLHLVMDLAFGFLFINSLFQNILSANRVFYGIIFAYSIVATLLLFFVLKKESILSQFLIYLSIMMLFLFGGLVTSNKPSTPATTFMVILIITPLFMIDKPYYMILVLILASASFIVWMYFIKDYEVWKMDFVNTLIFSVVSMIIHVIANSIRIKEFVLIRRINIQKDLDELTGISNKAAITRGINEYLADKSKNKAIMMMLDIDRFKSINDDYGHDVGDIVLTQVGSFLKETFSHGEIVGRFGGDEFIIFIKDTNDVNEVKKAALSITDHITDYVKVAGIDLKVVVSVGVAIYQGQENNYSEIFKKADTALYRTKANPQVNYSIYSDKN